MNINSLKKLSPGLIIRALFLIIAFIVHSCKKDNNKNETINSDAVNQAKAWYESTYTASYINRNRVISPSAASAKNSCRLFN